MEGDLEHHGRERFDWTRAADRATGLEYFTWRSDGDHFSIVTETRDNGTSTSRGKRISEGYVDNPWAPPPPTWDRYGRPKEEAAA